MNYTHKHEQAFWDDIKIGEVPKHCPELGRCWERTLHSDKSGYTKVETGGVIIFSHRLSWMIHHGEIPDGILVCHKCDNPPCVNPSHLFLGTHKDNMQDCISKKRHNKPFGKDNGAVKYPERLMRGEKCHSAKLTADKVIQIRKDYQGGISQANLAAVHGVGQPHISQIILRKVWCHV